MKLFLFFGMAALLVGCGVHVNRSIGDRNKRITDVLERIVNSDVYPGLQYVIVDTGGAIFEYFGGWADIQNRIPMKPTTTLSKANCHWTTVSRPTFL